MSRLRIISLAHHATWSDVICQDTVEKISAVIICLIGISVDILHKEQF
jgi:hypothetical protein